MIFLRRQVPLLITLITGLVFAAQYYVPHPASEQMLTSVTKWLQIIGGFALVLGVTSLFHIQAVKIRRKADSIIEKKLKRYIGRVGGFFAFSKN